MKKNIGYVKEDKGSKSFALVGYTTMTIVSIIAFIPFWLMFSASISDEMTVITEGFSLLPKKFSLDAYRSIFMGYKQLLSSYGVTILITCVGTLLSMLFTSMTGYVLMRQDFRARNKVSFFIYFTSLFSGGVIPIYILYVKYLHLKNSIWALILPCILSPWNIFLMRNYMKSIPYSLIDAATIDGASDWQTYTKIIMPLCKAGLATVGLFVALTYWNDWYHASLYITNENMYPLQYLLYRMLSNADYMKQAAASGVITDGMVMPSETLKMATAIVVTGPILLLYPFIQKYFVKGIMVGSIKG